MLRASSNATNRFSTIMNQIKLSKPGFGEEIENIDRNSVNRLAPA